MDFLGDLSQRINPVIQHHALFAGERSLNGESSTGPFIHPASIESVLTSNRTQATVNKHLNRVDTVSLRKERMLENGQIKVFTQAIDSYYNSILDPVLSTSTSQTSNTIISSTGDTANLISLDDIEMTTSSTQYSKSLENRVSWISDNCASKGKKNCQEQKTWNSEVGKKILAVHFSPMNIKSEFLSTQTTLDGFESFALHEAVHAVQEIIFKQSSDVCLAALRYDLCTDPRPIDLVRSAEKSRAFRKLHINDKIHLLKNAFFSLNSLKNLISYDPQIDGWYFADKIYSRKRLYLKHPDAYRKAVHIMDTFPDRFKTDFNVLTLLFFIMIFYADLPGLKYRNSIKSEQYTYIYLLRRYLESSIQPTCDALEYFYQLMVIIEEIQELRRATEVMFDDSVTDGSYLLQNRVVKCIELASIQQ